MKAHNEGLLSPFLRRRRIRAALPCLTGTVLDFGCGPGHLAAHVDPARYTGVDVNTGSLERARSLHREHRFMTVREFEENPSSYDTIVALAVIEHVNDPGEFLRTLNSHLNPGGRIVISTPPPLADLIHRAGSRIGLFSSDASREHQNILVKRDVLKLSEQSGLRIASCRRFLLGLNQLFVLERG